MNPVHFLFPSADVGPARGRESCGCSDIQEESDCGYLEDEPTVTSEIVETGEPYKEIEVLINDNRMVLRIQRLPVLQKEEWDPPCDCLPGSPEKSETKPEKVITAVPPPSPAQPADPLKSSKQRPIDLAENPNVFLLKIRKRSETSDRKRENIDLEFRTPRPWLSKPIEKKRKLLREEYQEQQAISEDNNEAPKPKKSKKGKK